MRNFLIAAGAISVLLVAGCSDFTAERVKEINDNWFKMYNQDRNPTQTEMEQYAAMDEAGRTKWKEEGKPVSRVLPGELADAANDFYKAVNQEVKSKEE
jgi:outer membrane murein-binding lipoprotein Lpp